MTDREIVLLLETEESAEDPSLSAPVMSGDPEHLAFSDHLCSFDAVDYSSALLHLRAGKSVYGPPSSKHSQPVVYKALVRR